MQDFKYYLDKNKEIGFVEKSLHTLVYISGLPRARPSEVIIFETGEVGQVLSLTEEYVEVLLLSKTRVHVGTKAARSNSHLTIDVDDSLLGKTVDSLGTPMGMSKNTPKNTKKTTSLPRPIEVLPPGIDKRKNIDKSLETGVTMVDLVIPLGKGQRELVVGDRKTGKTQFLLQAVLSAALTGTIAIYAAIAKKQQDIKMIEEFFKSHGIDKSSVIVASSSADPAGEVFLTPYTAMTIAEYFRDQGKDVLIILDDLTAHAKYYREITLLARRFPGRSSYPGDIFYVHSRLLERAGNFKVNSQNIKDTNGQSKGVAQTGQVGNPDAIKAKKSKVIKGNGAIDVSISALPVAELVMGDLSGYIQTNLMAITDGHIFFDIDLYNAGRRPPINPFLSVTRVGRQAQTPLLRDLSGQLTSFLVGVEKVSQFIHFGAELSDESRKTLALGDRVTALFNQPSDTIIPTNMSVILLAGLWGGYWKDTKVDEMLGEFRQIIEYYNKDKVYSGKMKNLVRNMDKFMDLVDFIKKDDSVILNLGRSA